MTLPSGTVTFLFSDIEGSTKLWEAHPEAMSTALARHDALMRKAIEGANGDIFKTVGDAFCCVFSAAPCALTAAIAAQLALCSEPWSEEANLKVRLALHTGSVESRESDYFGPPVNRVARLLAIGHGGQILLSLATHELVRDTLPAGSILRDMGVHRLKDLGRPETVYQLVHAGLPSSFPPLRSVDNADLKHNLPQQLTSFVGREKELAEIRDLMTTARLLTLIGSGGCGKTRLAIQASAEGLEQYSDGVWLVELAPVADSAMVSQVVAQTVGIREAPGEPITTTLLSALKNRQLLLVLDNCEHVLDASARLADAVLKSCPKVSVLVCSREALGIAGENSYRVPSLSVPPAPATLPAQGRSHGEVNPESLFDYESVRLFIERAVCARSDFAVTNENASKLASVCRRLDGIPLAIELAAARVRAMSLEQIEARLDSCFRLLTGGSRSALPRQQTLRSLIDWSYDLLNGLEKELLRRLAVFAGGWTLDACEVVCASGGIEDCDVLDLLTSLVDKSLVVYEERSTIARYRLLESVRQYAQDRLLESGESDDVRERHQGWFLALAETVARKLKGAEQAEWLDVLETEHENLRAALSWSLQDKEEGTRRTGGNRDRSGSDLSSDVGDGEIARESPTTDDQVPSRAKKWTERGGRPAALLLCGALQRFWSTRGYLSEGRQWCAQALAKSDGEDRTIERAHVLNAAGTLAATQGDYTSALNYHEGSLAIRREIGDRRGMASSLSNMSNVARYLGDTASASAYGEESLAIFREIGDLGGIALSLNNLGLAAHRRADYASARAYGEESLSMRRQIGDRSGIASSLNNLGIIAYSNSDNACAQGYFEESLTIQKEIGNPNGIAISLLNLGNVAISLGDLAAAQGYYEESLSIGKEIGNKSCIALSLGNMGTVASERTDYKSSRAYHEESLAIWREIGDKGGIADCLTSFAGIAAKEYQLEHSAALLAAANELREEIGSPLPPNDQEQYDSEVAAARTALGEEMFSASWEDGRAMTVEQAIGLALSI